MKAQGTYAAYLHGEILRVVPTYVALGVAVIVLAICIGRAKFPASIDCQRGNRRDRSRLAVERMAGCCVTGVDVGGRGAVLLRRCADQYVELADLLSEGLYLDERQGAGYFLTGSLVALAVGRIVSTPLMKFISPAKMIGLYAVLNILLLGVGVVHPGIVGASAILFTSFFMSVMFPTIFALGVKGLGDDTKLGGSFLVMAILGGAIFPPLLGWIARRDGQFGAGISAACRWICRCCTVRVYGAEADSRGWPGGS